MDQPSQPTATPSPSEPVILATCVSLSPKAAGRTTTIRLGIADLREQGKFIRQHVDKQARIMPKHERDSLDQLANVLIDLADWADGQISDDMIGLP